MDSKKALIKLFRENEEARERFRKLGDLPEQEAGKELRKFAEEFGIELNKEDFADQGLDGGQLESVAGGADVNPMDIIGVGKDIYEFINRPDDTGRGTKNGTRRYNRK